VTTSLAATVARSVRAISLALVGSTVHVLIVGCGYVGLQLGRQLTPAHRVTGVRRSDPGLQAVSDAGLEAVHADATNPTDLLTLPSVDVVVYAASAGAGSSARETYVEGLQTVIDHYGNRRDPPDRFVYTSSTGVYGDHGGAWVDEETPLDPMTDRERTLVEAERIAREHGNSGIDRTVVRFGGLYGPGRSPVARYLDGPISPGYTNFVHRDDAAGAVAHLLTDDVGRNTVVNVVDDEPQSRPDLADRFSRLAGVETPAVVPLEERDLPPGRRERLAANKRVSNERLHALGYELRYPTVVDGVRDGLDD
jgi:nucleoside-diphosphate-sugar epimerase